MKRMIAILLVCIIMLFICGCAKTRINKNAEVKLTFIYGEKNVNVVLTEEEAAKVVEILDGRNYSSVADGVPSCGFSRDISISVGGHIFGMACDTCNTVQDFGNLKYFDVAQEDMEYIHALFEKYGGYFPCV